MKKELQEELFALGPTLFRNREAQKGDPHQVQDAITRWGFECGNGWFDLLKEAIVGIEAHLQTLPEEVRGNLYAVQVKEKFAHLCFYMRQSNETIEELIQQAMDKSSQTCELCGAKGKGRNLKGWYVTLCDPHADPNFDIRRAMGHMF